MNRGYLHPNEPTTHKKILQECPKGLKNRRLKNVKGTFLHLADQPLLLTMLDSFLVMLGSFFFM